MLLRNGLGFSEVFQSITHSTPLQTKMCRQVWYRNSRAHRCLQSTIFTCSEQHSPQFPDSSGCRDAQCFQWLSLLRHPPARERCSPCIPAPQVDTLKSPEDFCSYKLHLTPGCPPQLNGRASLAEIILVENNILWSLFSLFCLYSPHI